MGRHPPQHCQSQETTDREAHYASVWISLSHQPSKFHSIWHDGWWCSSLPKSQRFYQELRKSVTPLLSQQQFRHVQWTSSYFISIKMKLECFFLFLLRPSKSEKNCTLLLDVNKRRSFWHMGDGRKKMFWREHQECAVWPNKNKAKQRNNQTKLV